MSRGKGFPTRCRPGMSGSGPRGVGTAGCERDGNGTDRERRPGVTAAPAPVHRRLADRPLVRVGRRAPGTGRAGPRNAHRGGRPRRRTAHRRARPRTARERARTASVLARAARGRRRGGRLRARRRLLPRLHRRPRPLPVRHRRLVAGPAHRHHRRPSRRPRPRPLVGRHRLRRRPHPRRPDALRLGARRNGQPHRRRPGRDSPAPPLAAGRPARLGGHPRHRRRRPGARRLRPGALGRGPLEPRDLDLLHRPRGGAGRRRLPPRQPHPALVPARPAPQGPAHRRPHRPGQTGPRRGRPARHRPAGLRRRHGQAGAASAVLHPADRPRLHPVDSQGPRRGAAARPADRAAQPAVAAGADLDRARRRRADRCPVRTDADRPGPIPIGQ